MVARPPMVNRPSPNFGYGVPYRPEAIVWHISQGTGASALSWLTSPQSQASSNYLIMESGQIVCLVNPDNGQNGAAWANGKVNRPDLTNPVIAGWVAAGVNPNVRSVSIEHAGYTSKGQGGSLTEAQVVSSKWLTAWLCEHFAIPATRVNVLRHAQIDSVDRPYCPGFSEQTEMLPWIADAAALVAGNPETGHGPVTVPPSGQVTQWLTAAGELVACINFGGRATSILGVNYADLGGSVRNAAGEDWDRSLTAGAFGPWVKRP